MEIDENASTSNAPAPKRTSLERKMLLRSYMSKVEDIQEREELGIEAVQDVGDIIRGINELDRECNIKDRIDQTNETLLDCLVLSSASSVMVKCIEALDVSTATYEPGDFSQKIISMYKDDGAEYDPIHLLKLLPEARSIIPEVPKYRNMFGAYDLNMQPRPKEKKERLKQVKEKLQKKEPEKVSNLQKEEEGIDEIVKVLNTVLKEGFQNNNERPIRYYDYVIDTDDYAKTVENMFYCSFLIRDGKAKIDLDSNLVALIAPMSKPELKAFRDEGGVNSQIITTITLDEWEKFTKEGLIQKYKKSKAKSKRQV